VDQQMETFFITKKEGKVSVTGITNKEYYLLGVQMSINIHLIEILAKAEHLIAILKIQN
jgi:uncharacterized protein YuzE